MGSTPGGFLAGFGLCLLIVSLGSLYGLYLTYTGSIQWADDINLIYSISHSEPYQAALSIIRNLGPLADLAKLLGANQSVLKYLSEVPKAASSMEEIQRASERAQKWISLLLPAMVVSVVLAIIGVAMLIAGYRIIKRQP